MPEWKDLPDAPGLYIEKHKGWNERLVPVRIKDGKPVWADSRPCTKFARWYGPIPEDKQ